MLAPHRLDNRKLNLVTVRCIHVPPEYFFVVLGLVYYYDVCDRSIHHLKLSHPEVVVALAVICDLHLVFAPDHGSRRRVELPSDSPVEAGAFEAVGRQSLLSLRVGLCSGVLLGDPLLLLIIPDHHATICVVPSVHPLPVHRADRFIKDVLVHPRILVEEEHYAGLYLSVFLRSDYSCHPDIDFVRSQIAKHSSHSLASLLDPQ